jgi:hypothetical protein
MTYPRGINYHEAGHAVAGWGLGLRVRISRVYYDDETGWKGDTQIADCSDLSLAQQIAICAAGYTAEQVFDCRAHELAALRDHAKIYMLLRAAEISEQNHPSRIAEANGLARRLLLARKSKVIALAERLIEYGHVHDASSFLRLR